MGPSKAPSTSPSKQPTTLHPTTADPTTSNPTTSQPTTSQPTTLLPTSQNTMQPTTTSSTASPTTSQNTLIATPFVTNECVDRLNTIIILSFGYYQKQSSSSDDLSVSEINQIIESITSTFIETEISQRAQNCSLDSYNQAVFIN